MSKIRITLLGSILSSNGVFQHKYTNAINSLKAIMELEKKETKNKLPKRLFDEFGILEIQAQNLNIENRQVPLIVVEQYFLRNARNLNKYIYIEYLDLNISVKVLDLYITLENWFAKAFLLATEIADYYNYEFKMKNPDNDNNEMLV